METKTTPTEINHERRGHAFYPPEAEWKAIPPLYAQDGKGDQAVAHLHYFIGSSDWYVTEVDHSTGEAFGWTVLKGDLDMAELGYIDLPELEEVAIYGAFPVERDLHFEPKTLGEVKAEVRKRLEG